MYWCGTSLKGQVIFENCRLKMEESSICRMGFGIIFGKTILKLNHLKQTLRDPDVIVRSNWEEVLPITLEDIDQIPA